MIEDVVEKLTVNCAACSKCLGTLTNEGWTWNTGRPARLVNKRRFITAVAVNVEPPCAPWDDFRMRTVQRDRFEDPEYTVWEFPYTCDADECSGALGADWEPTKNGPPFQVMPEGRVLSLRRVDRSCNTRYNRCMATKKRFAWEDKNLVTGEIQPGWQDTPVNARSEAMVALWDGHLKGRLLPMVSVEARLGRTEIYEIQVPVWLLAIFTILRRPDPVTILGAPVVANEDGEYVVRARVEQEPVPVTP